MTSSIEFPLLKWTQVAELSINSWPATKKNSGFDSYLSPLKFGLVVEDLFNKRAASEVGVHLGSITRFEPEKRQMPVIA